MATKSYGAEGDYSFGTGANNLAQGLCTFVAGYYVKAIGDYSAAYGVGTIAQNTGSFASGTYNKGTPTDTIFEVGIGDSDTDRKNAIEVYKNGIIKAPETTISSIDNADNYALITKEYLNNVLNNISSNTVSSLGDLNDVDAQGLTNGLLLVQRRGMWSSEGIEAVLNEGSIGDLGDVVTGLSTLDGSVLLYNPDYNTWESRDTAYLAQYIRIGELGDVDPAVIGPQHGDMLYWNNDDKMWCLTSSSTNVNIPVYLNQLTDVNYDPIIVQDGAILTYRNGRWTAEAPPTSNNSGTTNSIIDVVDYLPPASLLYYKKLIWSIADNALFACVSALNPLLQTRIVSGYVYLVPRYRKSSFILKEVI